MIGFKVDVGYCHSAQYNLITNINQISFLDIDRIFSIGTELDLNGFPRNSMKLYSGDMSSQQVLNGINDIKNSLAAEYGSVYAAMDDIVSNQSTWSTLADAWNIIFPSIFTQYTNTNKYFIDNQGTRPRVPLVIYFKNISRLVAFQMYSGNQGVAVYSGDTNLTLMKIYGSNNLFNCVNIARQYYCFPVVFGPLNNPESYKVLRVLIGMIGSNIVQNIQVGIYDATDVLYLLSVFSENPKPDISEGEDNPYAPGGDSEEGGGGGTFDNDSDVIVDSTLPTLSSSNTGFTRIYNPTLSQVQDLANYLWTDDSVITTIWNKIKQFFENPMDAIIGFNLVPVPVPNGGIEEFKLMFIPTGVNMIVAANQFVDVDCGTLDIKEYYGSALDYSPYTKISIFLPFIGMVNVDVDEVMAKTLQIKYRVDIVTGSCVAKIFVAGNCIYQFTGHCAINIPFSSADFTNYVSAVIGIAKLAVGAYTAGVGAAMAAEVASASQQTSQQVTTTEITNTARNPSTGRQITTGTSRVVETVEAPVKASSTQASYSGLSPANVANTVGQIMSAKPHIEHAGGFSGNSGYLGVRRPFAIIKRPRMCMPANYQTLNGFPSMITMTLSECSGYTLVNQVQLTGMSATNPEQAEILELLKSGVIF